MAKLSVVPREQVYLPPGVYHWPNHPDLWIVVQGKDARYTVPRRGGTWRGKLAWHGDPTGLRRLPRAQEARIYSQLEVPRPSPAGGGRLRVPTTAQAVGVVTDRVILGNEFLDVQLPGAASAVQGLLAGYRGRRVRLIVELVDE